MEKIVYRVFLPLSKNVHSYAMCQIGAVVEKYGYSLDNKWSDIKDSVQNILLYGTVEESFIYSYENMYGEIKEYNSTLLTLTAPALLDGSKIVGLAVKLIDKTPFAKSLE